MPNTLPPTPATRSIFADHALLENGWQEHILIELGEDGLISAVTKSPDAAATAQQHCHYIVPALVNVHSHAFQRALAGTVETRAHNAGDDFWGWREQMYRLVSRLQPEQIEAITAQAFMEMLEAGFAAAGEFHYLHHQPDGRRYDNVAEISERIIAAAATTGIGLTLLPVLYGQADADGGPLQHGQRRFGNTVDEYLQLFTQAGVCLRQHLSADCNIGIAPHSLRAVAAPQLQQLLQEVRQQTLPVHMHVAEQQREVQSVRRHLGLAPISWLLEHVDLDRHWCLIHATHASNAELEAVARAGSIIGLCPQTEANLGDGFFAACAWTRLNGGMAIGTDCNVDISVTGELRLLDYGQRLLHQRRQPLMPAAGSQGQQLYQHCLHGGARALLRNNGVIGAGYVADLVHLDGATEALGNLGAEQILDGWIFAGGQAMVRDVWSAGRHCVVAGQHRHHQAISQRYRATMAALGAGNAEPQLGHK